MISDWRQLLGSPQLPFIVEQLHAWLHTDDIGLALMRQAQLQALNLPAVGLSTAFDGGDPASAMAGEPGGTVHPHNKFIPARRAAATYAGQFLGLPVPYLNPRYRSATATSSSNASATVLTVRVDFLPGTVGSGLQLLPWDAASNSSHCPTERAINASYCDWFAIQVNDNAVNGTWHNSSVQVSGDGQALLLTAVVPRGLSAVATRNGYSDWPVVTAYTREGFPVLTWKEDIN
jgi:hypothetical protein